MNKKIGYFLMFLLVLWGLLLLSATQNRSQAQHTPPTTTQPSVQTTAPDDRQETLPPLVQAPPQITLPENPARQKVLQALEGRELDTTARSHRVYEAELNPQEGTEGTASDSCGYALAELTQERRMNPIAAFWRLVTAELYEKTADPAGKLDVPAFEVPAQEKREYPYTAEGAGLLLSDLLNLSAGFADGLGLETAILGGSTTVEPDWVQESAEEDCRYAYFVCSGKRSTHILCFYLRGSDGKQITDVEFQLLNLRHATGDASALAVLDSRGDAQAAVLMAATELLLTGKTQAADGQVTFAHSLEGFQATVERYRFTAEGERGTLTNYRLKKG